MNKGYLIRDSWTQFLSSHCHSHSTYLSFLTLTTLSETIADICVHMYTTQPALVKNSLIRIDESNFLQLIITEKRNNNKRKHPQSANFCQAAILNFDKRHISSRSHLRCIVKFCEDILNHSWTIASGWLVMNSDLDISKVSDIWHSFWTFMPYFMKVELIIFEKSLLTPC